MSSLDQEVLRKIKEWLVYADEDLRLAQHGLTLVERCPYRLIAYHAQQCAEKHLKAYLVYQKIDFPYTHNISRLLELCPEQTNWPKTILEAEELTPYAITARYSGEDEEVTREEAEQAVRIAVSTREIIRANLKEVLDLA